MSGGTLSNSVLNNGYLKLESNCSAYDFNINSGYVEVQGYASGINIQKGHCTVISSGHAENITISSGASTYCSLNGYINGLTVKNGRYYIYKCNSKN